MDNRARVLLPKASAAARKIGARLALVVASASLLGSCGSPWKRGEPWSFALTRDVLDRDPNQPRYHDWDRPEPSQVDNPNDSRSSSTFHGGVEELLVLGIFCLPTVIDLVVLPVTGVHDLCVD